MTNELQVEGYANDGTGEVLLFSPGTPMTDPQWAAVIDSAVELFGMDPTEILSTPYGYAPMPRPPLGRPDGTGRLPRGITRVSVLCHPVLWLDRATRKQGEDEPDDVYAVRLWMELYDRGFIHPVSQKPINPFIEEGLDPLNDELQRDLIDFANGEQVGWLAKFVIDRPATSPGRDVFAERANDAALEHRLAYYEIKQYAHDTLEQLRLRSVAALASADLRRDGQQVMDAGQLLLQTGADADSRRALSAAVRDMLQRIRMLDDHRLALEVVAEAVSEHRVVLARDVDAPLEGAHYERTAKSDQLLAAVNHAPSPDSLAALWAALSGWWSATGAGPRALDG
jgi:hypothetical protein